MKRLTQYNEEADEIDFLIDDAANRGAFDILDLAKYRADYADFDEFLLKIAEKLKKYEDLEEKCIKENSWELGILLEKWKAFYEDIQELYEYRQLEEQGKMLKLRCAVGDRIYRIDTDEKIKDRKIEIYDIDNIVILADGSILLKYDAYDGVICEHENIVTDKPYLDYYRCFLSMPEAEETLKNMKKG